MSFERKQKAFNRKYLKAEGKLFYETIQESPGETEGIPEGAGVYHTTIPTLGLTFKRGPNERVISHGDCYITLGHDKPGNMASGWGARGIPSATIDLVVGRGMNVRDGEGPKEEQIVSNMFSADASRIYISQLTEIDKNFGIAPAVPNTNRPGPGIGIKSDDIRIIGKNSMKLVSGKADGVEGYPDGEPNGFAGKSSTAPTIQLIAGNFTGNKWVYGGLQNPIEEIPYLQAAIKGENMVKCMEELVEIIGNLWSAVFNHMLVQNGFNALVGVDPLRPWVSAGAPPAKMLDGIFGLKTLHATRVKMTMFNKYYLSDDGYRCIKSPNIYLT